MDLQENIIIVTGGSGLIGKAIIAKIRNCGGVAVNADIAAPKNLPGNEYTLDIGDEASILRLRDAVLQCHGRVDGLVNCVYPRTEDFRTPFEEIPAESWRKNIDMHLTGYALCCRAILSQMKKQGRGSVVNIASIMGVVAPNLDIYEGTECQPTPAVYSAIKGGIIQLTKYLASLYGPCGIRVNAVSPGGIYNNHDPLFVERFSAKTMLRRMETPEDVAGPVAFLLSDDARYITGHNLMVDGGYVEM